MGNIRVLIVEDQTTTATIVQRQLESLGYAVAGVCTTREEAVRSALELKPDVILMDIVLEDGLDGIDAAQAIREQSEIPVVFMTAYADATVIERAQHVHPAGFINKPVTRKDLLSSIYFALNAEPGVRAGREAVRDTREAAASEPTGRSSREPLSLDVALDAFSAVSNSLPAGVALLDRNLKVYETNHDASRLFAAGSFISILEGHLNVHDEEARSKLRKFVSDSDAPMEEYRLKISEYPGSESLDLTVRRVNTADTSGAAEQYFLLFLFEPSTRSRLDIATLRQLYKLTVSEARVAALIVDGKSIDKIADDLKISVHTARTHLKRIFHKTGTHRQAELVHRLVTGPAAIGPSMDQS